MAAFLCGFVGLFLVLGGEVLGKRRASSLLRKLLFFLGTALILLSIFLFIRLIGQA